VDENHLGDRMSLELVGAQMELARAVLASGRPTVVVLIHGSPLAIPELAQKAPAILDGFYLGEETGTAVANVIFGDANPAGHLPWTVPRSSGAVPAYYNHKPSATRAYLFEVPGHCGRLAMACPTPPSATIRSKSARPACAEAAPPSL